MWLYRGLITADNCKFVTLKKYGNHIVLSLKHWCVSLLHACCLFLLTDLTSCLNKYAYMRIEIGLHFSLNWCAEFMQPDFMSTKLFAVAGLTVE